MFMMVRICGDRTSNIEKGTRMNAVICRGIAVCLLVGWYRNERLGATAVIQNLGWFLLAGY
jgi:hypothetical protein